ncbi:MAG TPA: hypothetical protein VNR68_09085 [Sphingomicrobium sp.]|nr:hypothetical protein [Sphingomicrobium sp.]
MLSSGNDKVLIATFIALAMSSVAIKAAAGIPPDGWVDPRAGMAEQQMVSQLRSQGFVTTVRRMRFLTPIVYGQRVGCRLSVRDARGGEAMNTVFQTEASSIGPVRYLYKRRRYSSPPGLTVRLGRLEAELLNRLRLHGTVHIPVALATSNECEGSDFGLDDIRVPS